MAASHAPSSSRAKALPVHAETQGWKSSLGTLRTYARPRSGLHVRGGIIYPPDPITIEYLLHRRELNPARFDHYHPHLGKILARDERLRAAGPSCSPMHGLLSNTPFHRYLHWRRNLNPARFDHYHHTLGALLAEDDRLRKLPRCAPGGVMPPPGGPGVGPPAGTPGGHTGGGGGPPAVVPEPSSIALVALGLGVVTMAGLRRRRRIA